MSTPLGLRVGTRVRVGFGTGPGRRAVVVRNGRDAHGLYTEVRYGNGRVERLNRDHIHAEEVDHGNQE
jgi:hypothetical protein